MDGAIFSLRPAPSSPGFTRPPRLIARAPAADEPATKRRTKVWEFSTNLHCSIVGTCLSTAELRQLLTKLGVAQACANDHELHHTAVSLAGRHDLAAKLLHKALDQRHKLAISRFGRAAGADAVMALWREAVKAGDIPGAYWAVLTHPDTTQAVVRQVFGEVHMLSHLVGAANRADIRRLAELEAENGRLREKLRKQQEALHEAVTSRDSRIEALQRALADRGEAASAAPDTDVGALRQVVAALQTRLDREIRRREAADQRAAESRDALATLRVALTAAEEQAEGLQPAIPQAAEHPTAEHPTEEPPRLDGLSLLYVGGRPHQAQAIRALAERQGASGFEHHDGGVEDGLALLPHLAGRADLVLFPVDCVSHPAAQAVKKLCRQSGKRFVPLRGSGTAAFVTALRRTM